MAEKNKEPVSEEQRLQAELEQERAKNAQLETELTQERAKNVQLEMELTQERAKNTQLEAEKTEQAELITELTEQLAQSESRIKQTERKHGQVAITFEGSDYHLAAPKISTPLGVVTAEQLADNAALLAELIDKINGFVALYLKPVPQEKGV